MNLPMHTQRVRSESCLSASSKGSAKKPTSKERKGLHQIPERRTSDETNDPTMQVLVWDRGGDKKLKMPIGELYDKVGGLTCFVLHLLSTELMWHFQERRTSKKSEYQRKVA